MLQISLCEFKFICINSVVCVKVIRFTSSARTKAELETPKSRKKPHKRCKRSSLYTLQRVHFSKMDLFYSNATNNFY
jgi:hypothetical protein